MSAAALIARWGGQWTSLRGGNEKYVYGKRIPGSAVGRKVGDPLLRIVGEKIDSRAHFTEKSDGNRQGIQGYNNTFKSQEKGQKLWGKKGGNNQG